MREVVRKAVSSIRSRYSEQITLSDLAAEVFVSPYHFSRVFSSEVGVTPGQYLSAVRFFEAKRLLLTTTLTVSDIVCSVGYNSVGTFTSRFTRAVGMSPTQYRHPEVKRMMLAVSPEFQRLPTPELVRQAERSCGAAGGGSVDCAVELPRSAGRVDFLVGVFADSIPQCAPVAYHTGSASRTVRVTVHDVPEGRWTVIAVACRAGALPLLLGASRQRIAVTRGRTAPVTVRLRDLVPTDPPIAVTLVSRLPSQQSYAAAESTAA